MQLIKLLDIISPHQKITITKHVKGETGEEILFSGMLKEWKPHLNDIIGYRVDCAFSHYGDEFSVTVF